MWSHIDVSNYIYIYIAFLLIVGGLVCLNYFVLSISSIFSDFQRWEQPLVLMAVTHVACETAHLWDVLIYLGDITALTLLHQYNGVHTCGPEIGEIDLPPPPQNWAVNLMVKAENRRGSG